MDDEVRMVAVMMLMMTVLLHVQHAAAMHALFCYCTVESFLIINTPPHYQYTINAPLKSSS